jgi:hypothetical protein
MSKISLPPSKATKVETSGMTVGSGAILGKAKRHPRVALRFPRRESPGSVEEQVKQDQDDRRDTKNPSKDIFTHDSAPFECHVISVSSA